MRHARVGDPRELATVRVARVDLVDRAPPVARVHEAVVDERVDLVLGPFCPTSCIPPSAIAHTMRRFLTLSRLICVSFE